MVSIKGEKRREKEGESGRTGTSYEEKSYEILNISVGKVAATK